MKYNFVNKNILLFSILCLVFPSGVFAKNATPSRFLAPASQTSVSVVAASRFASAQVQVLNTAQAACILAMQKNSDNFVQDQAQLDFNRTQNCFPLQVASVKQPHSLAVLVKSAALISIAVVPGLVFTANTILPFNASGREVPAIVVLLLLVVPVLYFERKRIPSKIAIGIFPQLNNPDIFRLQIMRC